MARASAESRGTPHQGAIPLVADTAQWGVKFPCFHLRNDGLVTEVTDMARVHYSDCLNFAALPLGVLSTDHALRDDDAGFADVRRHLFGMPAETSNPVLLHAHA